MMKVGRMSRLAGVVAIAGAASYAVIGYASNVDAERVLGMEDPSDWTIQNGTIAGVSTERTQGAGALEVIPQGYAVLTSRLIGPLGNVADTVSFDVRLPDVQPNPFWFGDAQLFVSVPSLGIHNRFIGQRPLTGLSLGEFAQLSFQLEPDLADSLRQQYFDLQFSVVLNVPPEASGVYLVDNLQVSSEIPGHSTISSPDLPRILGFESDDDWSTDRGTITLALSPKTEGNTSLAIVPDGYTTLTSLPMTTIGPVDPQISFDLFIPAEQPDPNWFGSVQLYVDSPMLDLHNQFLGEHQLFGLEVDRFHNFEFTLSSELQSALNSAGYSDLRFRIALNAPQGASVHFIDNLQVGEVTRPLEPLAFQLRGDLVGRTSSGVISIEVDGNNDSPAVQDALFHVKSEDGNCQPGPAQVCRYLVNVVRIRVSQFSLDGNGFSGAIIRNLNPFRLSVGGGTGTTVPIPNGVEFVGYIADSADQFVSGMTGRNLTFTIDPSGGGLMVLSGSFVGSVLGKRVTATGVVTADSPLLNHPPVADAGTDQIVSSTSGCQVTVTLDGSGTVDPNSNLERLSWRWNGGIVAVGESPQVTLDRSGSWFFQLEAMDTIGGVDFDSVVVTANLPAECGTL